MMRYKKELLTLGALYAAGLAFILLTNPERLPLPVLILPFVFIFVTIFLTIRLLVTIFTGSRALGTSIGMTITIFIVLTLVLASIRQLSPRDLVISLAITILLSWYLIKARKL